jgi:hypothetical protein
MLVGIHQLHYLPWLRYFDKVARSDVFIALDTVQFNKNGWQNRNRIKTPQGAGLLTVPVLAKFGQRLDQVRINNAVPWRKKHWRSIEQNYGRAPFFGEFAAVLSSTYSRKWDDLNDINQHLLALFVEWLGLDTRIVYASELNVPGEATERLVNLVKSAGGTRYYSGAYAVEQYLDVSLLDKAGIGLELQTWQAPEYPQLHGEFVPDLSVLDLLMNCGPDSLGILLGEKT